MRTIERRPFPTERRFVLGAMRVGRRAIPMTALVQVDVTDAWRLLRSDGLSPTAFVAACVGRAVAAHPEVHAYRDWLGRLVVHRHVDVTTMVEVEAAGGPFPLAHPLRDTQARTVADLSRELRTIRHTPVSGRSGRLLLRWGPLAGRIPGLATLIYLLAQRTALVRSQIGTVSLSSVGMMVGGNGFAIGVPTISSLTVVLGGATERPWVVDGEVAIRRILDVSVQVDHRVVDGGPAGRFGATLRSLLEDPSLIDW